MHHCTTSTPTALLQGMNTDLALNFARMTLTMDATDNSSTCLAAQSCLPLGGHSVLATLPPLPPPANSSGGTPAAAAAADLPALWVLAQVDTAALFHEAAVGADAPVSGLIAMLAAAEALGSSNATAALAAAGARYQRRLVFAALAGEPWGMMGSKRLLWELSTAASNSSLAGLGLTNGSLAGVLEVDQVGRARQPSGAVQLFAHSPAGGPPADFLAALQAAAANSSQGGGPASVSVAAASAAAPGLPPTASAGSFVRVGGASVPAVLLSGFDAAFQGSTYHTQYDTLETVDADSIAATAVVLARAAHALALSGGNGSAAPNVPLPVDYAAVRGTVDALMQVGDAGTGRGSHVARFARFGCLCLSSLPPRARAYLAPLPPPPATSRLPSVPAEQHHGPQLPAGQADDDCNCRRQGVTLHRHPAHPHGR